MIRASIVGASGYGGGELVRLLSGHRHVEIVAATAMQQQGRRVDESFPSLRAFNELTMEAPDWEALARASDVVFLALPHGVSQDGAPKLLEAGARVIDIAADFRLKDLASHQQWYGAHQAPELLASAVYGLPELHAGEIAQARLVACPGCYPTASILAIAPLLEAGLVSPEGLIVDAKSGASGAGRGTSLGTHFSEIGEGIRPYKVAGTHRHTPEIEQELTGLAGGREVRLLFTPHLVPMTRGIVACVYATPTETSRPEGAYHHALASRWAGEPFVSVLPPGQLPDTSFVRASNRIHVAVAYDARARRVLAMSAIDNLVKGASGQAIQCMNLVLGFPETAGLTQPPLFP